MPRLGVQAGRMTVAVAASLTDLPLSLATLLDMDDSPDTPPMVPPRSPTTRTTTAITTHYLTAPPTTGVTTTHYLNFPTTATTTMPPQLSGTLAPSTSTSPDYLTLQSLPTITTTPYTPPVPPSTTLHPLQPPIPQHSPPAYTPPSIPRTTFVDPQSTSQSTPIMTQTIPKTTFESLAAPQPTPAAPHTTPTLFETIAGDGGHGGSFSWEGVSPDPALTPSLSLYGSPGLPTHSTPTPEAVQPAHSQGSSQDVSVTMADLSLSLPPPYTAPPAYTLTSLDAPYSTLDPSLPGPSHWSGLEGSEDPLSSAWLPQAPSAMPMSEPMTEPWSWPTQSPSVPQDPWPAPAPAPPAPLVRTPPQDVAALSPGSLEVAGRLGEVVAQTHSRRSHSRSPLSPGAATPCPSPRSPLHPPPSPLLPQHSDRRRWRPRQQQQQQGELRRLEEGEGEWGRGSGWRRWPRTRRSHSLTHMDSAGAAPAESGGPGTPSPALSAQPSPSRSHDPGGEGQDDEEDDTEQRRVCVPPGESL